MVATTSMDSLSVRASRFTIYDFDVEILLFFIGFYYVILWHSRYLRMIFRIYCGTHCTAERYGKESWAVVTGACGGLGKEACIQLAEKGFNIVMISGEEAKLKQVQALVKAANQKA